MNIAPQTRGCKTASDVASTGEKLPWTTKTVAVRTLAETDASLPCSRLLACATFVLRQLAILHPDELNIYLSLNQIVAYRRGNSYIVVYGARFWQLIAEAIAAKRLTPSTRISIRLVDEHDTDTIACLGRLDVLQTFGFFLEKSSWRTFCRIWWALKHKFLGDAHFALARFPLPQTLKALARLLGRTPSHIRRIFPKVLQSVSSTETCAETNVDFTDRANQSVEVRRHDIAQQTELPAGDTRTRKRRS